MPWRPDVGHVSSRRGDLPGQDRAPPRPRAAPYIARALVAAIFLANSLLTQSASIWFNPEIGAQLDHGLDVYKDYVRVIKDDMRHQTDALASSEALRDAVSRGHRPSVERELSALFPQHPELGRSR